jgi:lysophospholipase L1-like esterase
VGGASAGSGAGGASAGSSSVGGAGSSSGGSAGTAFGSGGTGGAKIDYGAGGLIEPNVPPAYNPCANLSVCTILPLGDSITFGDRSSDQAGWRSRLFHLALSGKKSITFTGGQTNGPDSVDGVPFPKHHQGHPGYEISGAHGIQYFTAQSVTTFPAQILTLLIGTNDMAVNNDPPNAPARLAELIDLILATDPKLLVVVGLITPTQDDGLNALVQAYNAAIPGIVSARAAAGKHIALIDLWTPLTSNPNYKTELLDDKLHPNDAGYSKMAETWYKMLGGLFPTAP